MDGRANWWIEMWLRFCFFSSLSLSIYLSFFLSIWNAQFCETSSRIESSQLWNEQNSVLTSECASRHSGVHFFNISTSKNAPNVVFLVFSLSTVLRATTACNFSSLSPPDACEPTFRPSEASKHSKNTAFRNFCTFSCALILVLLTLPLLCPTVAASVHKSEIWLQNFLRLYEEYCMYVCMRCMSVCAYCCVRCSCFIFLPFGPGPAQQWSGGSGSGAVTSELQEVQFWSCTWDL